jgi:hypothetical protein
MRADPTHGHNGYVTVFVERLLLGVYAGRHYFDPACVLGGGISQVRVPCDDQPGSLKAADTAFRFAFQPPEPSVDLGGRPQEEGIVQVVHVEASGRIKTR